MATKKQAYNNDLQAAFGALTGLPADKLPSDVTSTWLADYQAALRDEGLSSGAVPGHAPEDGEYVAVWPTEEGLKAEYVKTHDPKRTWHVMTYFVTSFKEDIAVSSTQTLPEGEEGVASDGKQ